MNNTEAWEMVNKAARNFGMIDETESTITGSRMLPKLSMAIKQVEPKILRMRARLDDTRARRAGTPKLPAWMKP
jgi:hypothetical protein